MRKYIFLILQSLCLWALFLVIFPIHKQEDNIHVWVGTLCLALIVSGLIGRKSESRGLTNSWTMAAMWGACALPFLFEQMSWKLLTNAALLASVPMLAAFYLLRGKGRFFGASWGEIAMWTFTWWLFVSSLNTFQTNCDIWQIYDLSKDIFSAFYRMDIIRQHIYDSQYGIGFPPIYPLLMNVSNLFIPQGIVSYLTLNFLFLTLSLFQIKLIAKHFKMSPLWPILGVSLMLLPEFMLEVRLGGTTPLTVLLLISVLRIIIQQFSKPSFDKKCLLIIGCLIGVGMMTRFDFIPTGGAFILYLLYLLHQKNECHKCLYLFVPVGIILLPWVIYSWTHFHTLFVSDNGWRLTNVLDTRPTTFYPSDSPADTCFTNFGDWFVAFTGRARVAFYGFRFVIWHSALPYLIVLVAMCSKRIRRLPYTKSFLCLALCLAPSCAAIVATGYPDIRYYNPFVFCVSLLLAIVLHGALKKKTTQFLMCTIATALLIINFNAIAPNIRVLLRHNRDSAQTAEIIKNTKSQQIIDFMQKIDMGRLVFDRNSMEEYSYPQMACEGQIISSLAPSNLSAYNAAAFFSFFKFTHCFFEDALIVEMLENEQLISPTSIDGLYEIRLPDIVP